jgi:hypothetical protein
VLHRRDTRRIFAQAVEHDPQVGVAVVEAAVTDGLTVIGLLAPGHED